MSPEMNVKQFVVNPPVNSIYHGRIWVSEDETTAVETVKRFCIWGGSDKKMYHLETNHAIVGFEIRSGNIDRCVEALKTAGYIQAEEKEFETFFWFYQIW